MTSRERVLMAINRKTPERIPVDFGGCVTTGIHAVSLALLRDYLKLERKTVKVYEPMMFLGEVEDDVRQALGGDVAGLNSPATLLGYSNKDWKRRRHPAGVDVMIGGGFLSSTGPGSTIYAYPGGDETAQPSVVMPKDGLYFDNLIRQEDLYGHVYDARADYHDQ